MASKWLSLFALSDLVVKVLHKLVNVFMYICTLVELFRSTTESLQHV